MKVRGNRKFRSDTGRRYYVQNASKNEVEGDKKYLLSVEKEDGFLTFCYDPFFKLLKFRTIKEAQLYVFLNEWVIQTL